MEADYATAYSRLYREHWWWRVRERVLLETIREILPPDVANARILDVGCGAAVFFEALEAFGHVEGIESDRLLAEQSGRWRTRIHIGELDETFTPGHSFDLILFLDVLEHVKDPGELLARAARMLAADGHIVATVPAFQALWTSHDEMNHHQKRYTASEIRSLFSAAGLVHIRTRYLFHSLVLPKLLVRARESLVRPDSSLPKIPGRPLNFALQMWYRGEHTIAGWLPFGSSVLAVAKAPE
jgi:SAM-dependent methyltransferase